MTDPRSPSLRTLAAQAGHFIDGATGAIIPPIHPATTYARNEAYELIGGASYTRDKNPTYTQVEHVIAELEGGADAMLFASGLAAMAALFETIPAGAHMVAPTIMYHGGQDWLRRLSETRDLDLTLFDVTDPDALNRAVRPGETAIVWIETPANPTWEITAIAAAAKTAHDAGAILGVDSTTATPVHTQALDLGADVVFHSVTKYLNGHSDVLGGALVTREDDARWSEIKEVRKLTGGVAGPFEAWLLLRGMRTLFLRVEQASANAMKIARHFENHPKLEAVLYPGLESHPGHAIAKRQMSGGFGGMLSILTAGGASEAKQVASATKVFIAATSLGGVESLIEHRATVEGPLSLVPANLLRLSVGIEDADDLIDDLEQALKRI